MGNSACCRTENKDQVISQCEDASEPIQQRGIGLSPAPSPVHRSDLSPAYRNERGRSKTETVLPSSQNEEELEELLSMFELTCTSIGTRYRLAAANPKVDTSLIKRADEVLARVGHQLRRLQHFKVRGQTWQGGEADRWVNMFVGSRKRFKSLAEIVRKVQVENRIVRHWQGHAKRASLCKGSSDNLIASLESSAGATKLDLESWATNIFEIEKENQQPLATVFMSIWKHKQLSTLSKARKGKVVDYIRTVESGYKENPYHNRIHAAEVTLMSYYFWSSLSAQQNFKGYFAEVDLLVLMIAAAIHDMGHPAVNNDFLVKTRSSLALRYHDRSVLENFHLATAFELMKDKGISLLEHNLPSPPVVSLRNRIVEMVLATDMSVHKTLVEDMEMEEKRNENRQDIDKRLLEKSLIHLADIGHPLRPVQQHQDWAKRVTQEFFTQGDREKDLGLTPIALFDRKQAPSLAKSQIGFLNFVVLPTFKPVASLLGPAAEAPNQCLQLNLKAWQAIADREDPVNAAAGGC